MLRALEGMKEEDITIPADPEKLGVEPGDKAEPEPVHSFDDPDAADKGGAAGGIFGDDKSMELLEEMATNVAEMLRLMPDIHQVMTED